MSLFTIHTRALYHWFSAGKLVAVVVSVSLLPVWLINALIAVVQGKPLLQVEYQTDALGRKIRCFRFTRGWLRDSAVCVNIFLGDLAWCGVSLSEKCEDLVDEEIINFPAGLFSLYNLHRKTGLKVADHGELISQHYHSDGLVFNGSLIAKTLLASLLYSGGKLTSPNRYRLFGVSINNVTMRQAVTQILTPMKFGRTRLCFFVNAHSINTCFDDKAFRETLAQGDYRFADGSGVRLASQKIGIRLKDNVNGTDLLPHLCRSASKQGQSLYLLGASPGVAQAAAENLKLDYPGLEIAGAQHGYFDSDATEEVIDTINRSGARILLVAFGSPAQEAWLVEHRDQLQVQTAMAVGGLFDFYSGNIARAPRWLRELGMEWIWRLLQEPKTKFHRYVVGNPLFLFRTYFLNREGL